MTKDIEWLKKEFDDLFNGKSILTVGKSVVDEILDQLDETETLSEQWIEQKSIDTLVDTLSGEILVMFRLYDLQHLLVPKQELPVIPKYVADAIEVTKMAQLNYYDMLKALEKEAVQDRTRRWVFRNLSAFVKAWLYGYTIEKEQLYFAKIKGHENISSDDKYWNYCITDESLDIGDNKVHADVLAEYVLNATKDEWENLGINDDNADFIKVEELEE